MLGYSFGRHRPWRWLLAVAALFVVYGGLAIPEAFISGEHAVGTAILFSLFFLAGIVMTLIKSDFLLFRDEARRNRRKATPNSVRQFFTDCAIAVVAYVALFFIAASLSTRFGLAHYFD
jgi:hypothetical protein